MKERSTYLGLITLFTVIGVTLNSDLQEAIINVGVSVAALLAILTKDVSPDPNPPKPPLIG